MFHRTRRWWELVLKCATTQNSWHQLQNNCVTKEYAATLSWCEIVVEDMKKLCICHFKWNHGNRYFVHESVNWSGLGRDASFIPVGMNIIMKSVVKDLLLLMSSVSEHPHLHSQCDPSVHTQCWIPGSRVTMKGRKTPYHLSSPGVWSHVISLLPHCTHQAITNSVPLRKNGL